MKTHVRWYYGFILICAIITYFSLQYMAQAEQNIQPNSSDRASDFTLSDLDGRVVKLSDYKGRIIVLYFMCTWCTDCRSAIPGLKDIYARYGAKGLILLNINVMESREKMTAYAKKHSLPYPTLLDRDGNVSRSYGVVGVPVKLLINRDGRIICWNCRSFDNLLEKQFERTGH
jgi:peroxiredoxin